MAFAALRELATYHQSTQMYVYYIDDGRPLQVGEVPANQRPLNDEELAAVEAIEAAEHGQEPVQPLQHIPTDQDAARALLALADNNVVGPMYVYYYEARA